MLSSSTAPSRASIEAEGASDQRVRPSEVIWRGVGVAELHGARRGNRQPQRRQLCVPDELVAHRCRESQGDLEREIACAGARFTQCTANVVLMGESIEDKLACGCLGGESERRCRRVDHLSPQVE